LLIKRLLLVDPSARLSAEEVLRHPWIAGDRRKLETKKLQSLVAMNQYVKKHKESIVELTVDIRASGEPETSTLSSSSSSSSSVSSSSDLLRNSESIVGNEENQTIFSVPLPPALLERVKNKYPEWPDYRTEFEIGNILGCADLKLIINTLKISSVWKIRALEAGYLRPFLILVSMHPRQRLGFANLLKIDLSSNLWYGDAHRESWEIISHQLEGIRVKTKGAENTWWDTLTQVSDATLAHFWSSDRDSKKAVANRPSLNKGEIKQALEDKNDQVIAGVEELFSDAVHNKLDKLRKDANPDSKSSYEGLADSLENLPITLRVFATNMKVVQNKALALKLLTWYGNEGYRRPPDNDKIFLAWVEKERTLNLSNVFLGKSRVRLLFPVVFAICLQRLALEMFAIYLQDFWPEK